MGMVVGLLFMARMVVLVGTVLAGMLVIVDMIVGPMVMFMAVFVVMGMVVGVAVLMAVGLPVVGVFVGVGVLVFVRMVMLMDVFAFHYVVLLSSSVLGDQGVSRSRWICRSQSGNRGFSTP